MDECYPTWGYTTTFFSSFNIAKYPILKKQGYYPSVINYEDAPSSATISVSVSQGSGAPA